MTSSSSDSLPTMNDLVKSGFNTHYALTLRDEPPHFNEMHVRNAQRCADLTMEQAKVLSMRAYLTFSTTGEQGKLRGSIDENPLFWTWVLLCALKQRPLPHDNIAIVNVPNGCCDKDICPIKEFYEIVAALLSE